MISEEVIVSLLKTNLAFFSEFFFPHAMVNKMPEFHKELYKIVLSDTRLVIAAPRGFAKSTIVAKFYPLFLGCNKKRSDICIISSSESLAAEHLRFIKTELEGNPALLRYYGDLRSDKWTETHIILKHKDGTIVNIRAKGAGAQIRGFRPDCLILDDIETDESVESEEQRKKLKDWLFKACINTLLPKGQLLLIGTVIHPLSVLADLLSTPNGWTKRKFQAYKDGIQEIGHELWPELWTHDRLQQRKREIGSFAFASEYMNDPLADEHAPIKEHQIRFWEQLPKQLSLVIAIDPAYSEDEKADFKVASLVGIDPNYIRYLVTYIRTHAPSGEFIDSVINLWLSNRYQITAVGIPNSGTEKEFFNSFVKKAQERNLPVPIVELKNTFTDISGKTIQKKSRRIIGALQPWFEQGKYFIHPDHFEAREELLTIGSSRWDDLVDTMAYAEQILTPAFIEETKNNDLDENTQMVANYGFN